MKINAMQKKKWLFLFAVAALFFLALSFASCEKGEPQKLSAPENVRVEHRVLCWDRVEYADYYLIQASNGETYETAECQFPLDTDTFGVDGQFQFKVFAKSNGDKYEASSYNHAIATLYAPKALAKDEQGCKYAWVEELQGYEVSNRSQSWLLKETLVIPDYFEDYPVKKIAVMGFTTAPDSVFIPSPTWWDGTYCNTVTVSLQLPKYLEVIGDTAFGFMTSLKEVVIPDTVTHIGEGAFTDCVSLKSVTLPQGLKELGRAAFADTALETLALPNTLEVIGDYAFKCFTTEEIYHVDSALSRVVIPGSVKVLGSEIFEGRENLTEIVHENAENIEDIRKDSLSTAWYESNVKVIDGVCYLGKVLIETQESFCLKEFTVPSFVKTIKSFNGRGAIEKLYIPDGVEFYDFFGCENLTELRLPADAANLPANGLKKMPKLEKLVIPEGVTDIENRFGKGSGIKELTISSKMLYMGKLIKKPGINAYCDSLTTIVCQGVAYTYSAEQPTEQGDWWYVDEDGFFAVW